MSQTNTITAINITEFKLFLDVVPNLLSRQILNMLNCRKLLPIGLETISLFVAM